MRHFTPFLFGVKSLRRGIFYTYGTSHISVFSSLVQLEALVLDSAAPGAALFGAEGR